MDHISDAGQPVTLRARHSTIVNIQLLRFIAAFIVVLGHGQIYMQTRGLAGPDFQGFSLIDFRAGVDIFFVISGFVMYHVSRDSFGIREYPNSFLRRRLVRIMPLYWALTVLALAAVVAVPSFIRHANLNWQQIACSFLLLPYAKPSEDVSFPLLGVGWTLIDEMYFYFCFFLLLRLKRVAALRILGLGFFGAAIFHDIYLHDRYIRFLSEWTDPIILEFVFGVALAIVFQKGGKWRPSVGWLVTLAGFGLLVLVRPFETIPHFELYRPVIWGLPALIICAGLALIDQRFEAKGLLRKALLLGGNISYALYLSHEFTFNVICFIWRTLKLSNPGLLLGILCAVSIAVSIAIYKAFESPVTKGLNRLIHTRTFTPPHETPFSNS